MRIHRWLSLCAAALWLVQATTGICIVFHWEIDDALAGSHHAATDLPAIEHRISALAPVGSHRHVSQLWTSAGFADRYDLTVVDDRDGRESTVRIAGDGTVLRLRPPGQRGLMDTLVVLHQTLLSGDVGGWIIGASGLLLIGNFCAGLIAAWPRRPGWWRALRPRQTGPAVARYFSWHRALGLIGVVPALLMVSAGTTLVFEDALRSGIGGDAAVLPPAPGRATLSFTQATAIALHAVPGSTLTAVTFPDADNAIYKVRVLEPGEWRRGYGMTAIFVDGISGGIRGIFLASRAPGPQAFMDFLFPFHTGEAGGLVGRLLALALGVWLASMILIGLRLWWVRRRSRRRA